MTRKKLSQSPVTLSLPRDFPWLLETQVQNRLCFIAQESGIKPTRYLTALLVRSSHKAWMSVTLESVPALIERWGVPSKSAKKVTKNVAAEFVALLNEVCVPMIRLVPSAYLSHIFIVLYCLFTFCVQFPDHLSRLV